jgi:putative peptidoglycan lipid II flippase
MDLKRGLGWVGTLSLIGIVISFLSQLVFSYFFGISVGLDAYWVAFAIMNFLSFPMIAIREALVSEIHERSKVDASSASAYFSKAISLILTLSFCLAVVGIFFSDFLITLVIGDGELILYQEVLNKLLWLAPALILLALSDTFNALLTSYNKAVLQMASRVLAAGSTIAIIAFSANYFGSQALVIGFIAGQILNTIALAYVLHRQGLSFKPSMPTNFGSAFLGLSGALIFSYGLSQIYALYEKSIFLNFGIGIVSAFQYSVSVTNIVITVLGLSLANVLWPRFLKFISEKDHARVYAEGAVSIKLLAVILGWICTAIYLNAQDVVQIIFARGAFTEDAIQLTTLCLKMTIFAAIPIAISAVLSRALISFRASGSIVIVGITTAIIGMLVLFVASYVDDSRLAMSFWLIANIVGVILSGILFIRKTQANSYAFQNAFFWIIRYLLILMISVSLLYVHFMQWTLSSNVLVNLIYKFILFTILYALLVILFGLLRRVPLRSLLGRLP